MTRCFTPLTVIATALACFTTLTAQAQTFGVFRELWSGFSAADTTMGLLTNTVSNPNWPDNPNATFTRVFTNFITDANVLDGYGQRVRAFVVPPANGTYTFWIASDDLSNLFLSSDESPGSRVLIASVATWTNPTEWNKEANQQSAPVTLEAGRRYYIEALHREGAQGDHLTVRWQIPNGLIEEPMAGSSAAGTRLIPYRNLTNAPGIFTQPSAVAVTEGQPAVFSVLATNPTPISYQWQRDAANIGAAQSVFTLDPAQLSDDNALFRCVLSNAAGVVTSTVALLTVAADVTPPALVSAVNFGATNVSVAFSEPVEEAGATNALNYALSGGVTVSRATLTDPRNVTLNVSPLTFGNNYTLTVNGVRDRATTPNTIALNAQANFVAGDFVLANLGGPVPAGTFDAAGAGYDLSAGGGDIGGTADQCIFAYQTRTGNFDVQVRVAGLTPTDAWTKTGLMARETLAASGRFAATLATPSAGGCFFAARAVAGFAPALSGSFPVNHPWTYLRLQRAGNVFTGLASVDGTRWQILGTATMAMPAQVFLGLALASHAQGQAAVAQLRDFGTVAGGAIGAVTLPFEPLAACSRRTSLVISEIMYHPRDRADSNNLEFLEIYNSQAFFEDIGGYRLSGDIDFTFPAGTVLPAGGFLVVAASPSAMLAVQGVTALGPVTNNLPNDRGTVRLRNRQDAILLEVNYADTSPWPVAADGAGHSLVLARPSYGEGDPAAWAASDAIGGSPGGGESLAPDPLREVVINEFLADTDLPLVDTVELFNAGMTPVNLQGAWLTDRADTNKFRVTNSLVIPARGFVVFDQNQLGFSLSGGGEDIFLVNSNETRVLDAVRFEGQATGVSSGRFPDGAPTIHELAARTPGAANSPLLIRDIVINEIMYRPVSGNSEDEYVELHNRGVSTVNLGGWEFTGGINFTLPSNTVVAAGGYLVVAQSKTNLLARYAHLNATNTVGDFGGALANRGERLALSMPVAQGAGTGFVVVDEVTYDTGGRWGTWANGGGSSLELIDPHNDNRLAPNWADSDESAKTTNWTLMEIVGAMDNGNAGNAPDSVQFFLFDAGECLIDNVEVRTSTNGANLVANSTFESGITSWAFQGTHDTGIWQQTFGQNSARSLRVVASGGGDTGANRVRSTLTSSLPASGTATLRARVCWLRGATECLLRVRGNWLEAPGVLQTPRNLGSPGARNSRYVTNAGPALTGVNHSPALPAAGESVVVTARLHDPDGVASAQLKYRIDPAAGYTTVSMTDDGAGSDAVAGDGIYSATVPGQSSGALAAFYIQSTDAAGTPAMTAFPNDAPARECYVRFGETAPSGSFASYRIWMTAATLNRWSTREKRSNEPLDCTFVYGRSRVIYNMGAFYSGSAFHSPSYDSPIGAFCNYSFHFQDDDRLLGQRDFRILFPGNSNDDETYQREQTSYWLARELGLNYNHHRYVHLFINGVKRGNIIEDSQVPGGDTVNEFYPDDPDGDLFKISFWYEYVDDLSANTGIGATLGNFTTTGGAKKAARYRWNWDKRAVERSNHDFTNIFRLVDAVNATTNYIQQVENLVDSEEWMRVLAVEHIIGNWDSYGYRNGQNMFAYKPQNDRWKLLLWDIDISWGIGGYGDPVTHPIFDITSDALIGNMYSTPIFRRAYWRALQDAVNGPLLNATADPLLDSRYNGFVANGVGATAPTVIKNYMRDRRGFLTNQLATVAATLAVNGTNSFTTNRNLIRLTGTAPVGVKTLTVNGVPYPVTWTSVTAWSMLVPLADGTNTLLVHGLNNLGTAVTNAARTVTVNYTGPAVTPEGSVVINEIMYNPTVPGATFIEVFNASTNLAFDLSAWRLNGIDYTFPAGTVLTNRGFLVLANERYAFAAANGATNLPFDVFAGNLQTNGETLTLSRPGLAPGAELPVARVRYESTAPWPASAHGRGFSLQLIDARQDISRVANWADGIGWRFISVTGTLQANSTGTNLLVFLDSAGDFYIDDMVLTPNTGSSLGTNFLLNGDFESPLSGPWVVPANYSNSVINASIAHSGAGSFHVIGTSAGGAQVTSIVQPLLNAPTNLPYTLSFWLLTSTNGTNLNVRSFPGTAFVRAALNIRPVISTPNTVNSPAATLPPFPLAWINEVQPNNVSGPVDASATPEPWIELFNSSADAQPLDEFFLADNFTNLTQWAFPAGSALTNGEFRLAFADAQPGQTTAGEWHTAFRLNNSSGAVVLARLVGGQPQIVDYLKYANVGAGLSYGSLPDGQSFDRQLFHVVTPASNNYAPPVAVRINEWMAGNTGFITNAVNGQADDWFELYNPGGTPVDLGDYYLTDNLLNLTKWRIPDNTVIPAQGFLLVWADNAAAATNQPDLHASFALARGGESLALVAHDGLTVIDSLTFGTQTNNISQGRYADGAAALYFMSTPTPRSPNALNTAPTLGVLTNHTIFSSRSVQFTAVAADVDLPPQSLTFSVDPGAPIGALIGPANGVFHWSPAGNYIPSTNVITVRVTDDGTPPLSAARAFTVIVLSPPRIQGLAFNGLGHPVLTFETVPGKTYRLQFKNDLNDPIWIDLPGGDIPAGGDTLMITDTMPSPNQRFYRALQLD